jgi:hypothetical protein
MKRFGAMPTIDDELLNSYVGGRLAMEIDELDKIMGILSTGGHQRVCFEWSD